MANIVLYHDTHNFSFSPATSPYSKLYSPDYDQKAVLKVHKNAENDDEIYKKSFFKINVID